MGHLEFVFVIKESSLNHYIFFVGGAVMRSNKTGWGWLIFEWCCFHLISLDLIYLNFKGL